MKIQCECGKFSAELAKFPRNTPGRLKCYCDDCQAYLKYINRSDLLDQHGGSEIIPAYPADVKIISGSESLECVRLSEKGMYRFYTSCCNTPIANTDPKGPWAGIHGRAYTANDPQVLDRELGPVKSSIMGKFAKGTPPKGTPDTYDLKGVMTVFPFLFKGIVFGKRKPSPFFNEATPVVTPKVLTNEELLNLKNENR